MNDLIEYFGWDNNRSIPTQRIKNVEKAKFVSSRMLHTIEKYVLSNSFKDVDIAAISSFLSSNKSIIELLEKIAEDTK